MKLSSWNSQQSALGSLILGLHIATVAVQNLLQAEAAAATDSLQNRLIDRCCQVGREKAAESAKFNCKLSAREALVPGNGRGAGSSRSGSLLSLAAESLLDQEPQLADQCEMVLESCCLGHHRNRNCNSGKQFAKSGAACMDVELSREFTIATESFNDCCMACSLGQLAARSPGNNETSTSTSGRTTTTNRCKLISPLASSLAGQLYEQTYVECCQESLPRVSGALLLDPNAPIDCSQQTNACSQRCVSSTNLSDQDRCDCFPGYKLASDGTSCHDVDECRLNQHSCNRESEVCDNIPGSFRCLARRSSVGLQMSHSSSHHHQPEVESQFVSLRLCPPGFRWHQEESRCEQYLKTEPKSAKLFASSSSSSSSSSSFRHIRSSSSLSSSSSVSQPQNPNNH